MDVPNCENDLTSRFPWRINSGYGWDLQRCGEAKNLCNFGGLPLQATFVPKNFETSSKLRIGYGWDLWADGGWKLWFRVRLGSPEM